MRRRCDIREGQRGQAIVETLVIGGVASLLMLGIWYLGKFHDIQAATIQAARYAAWERTAQSTAKLSEADLQNQIRARLFTWSTAAYRSDDGRTAASRTANQPTNWQEHGSSRNLIARSEDIRVDTASGQLPGTAQGAVNNAFASLTSALSAVTGGERLPVGGLMRGTVRVKIADVQSLPPVLNALNLNLTETSSVVAEGWDASGTKQAAERARTFVLAGALGEADALLAPVKIAFSPVEPDITELGIGDVCPDIVPRDRLTGGTQRARYQGAQPCY